MNFIVYIVLALGLFSCGTKQKSVERTEGKGDAKTQQHSPAQKVTISGTITQTHSYCGGAAPPRELIEELKTPKPLPGKKMYIIKGDTNTTGRDIILNFISDENGNFSFQLEPGLYSVLLEEQISAPDAKKYRTETQSIDESCYNKWWARPYYLLTVEAGAKPTTIKGLNFNFHSRCFISSDVPCLEYEGPYPP